MRKGWSKVTLNKDVTIREGGCIFNYKKGQTGEVYIGHGPPKRGWLFHFDGYEKGKRIAKEFTEKHGMAATVHEWVQMIPLNAVDII